MTSPRWPDVKALFHETLERDAADRPAFLTDRCAADSDLRAEIDSLLLAHEHAGSFLEVPSVPARTGIAEGSRFGPYEIIGPLGAGGMGEVYRAKDTRLNRTVAIKVLVADLASRLELRQRLIREAEAAASLNHPNICALYDISEQDGTVFLVMEYLEGETLRSRLRHGPVPPPKARDMALQIIHGLAAAHERGVVHRDLKPENLWVTKDDGIKILDFGIAKVARSEAAAADETGAAAPASITQRGFVLGTSGYMSPEQASGLPTDHRSDLFAFGSILYELLSGTRAFGSDTAVQAIDAVSKEDAPPLASVEDAVTAALERVARRCLAKNPEERFQSARDVGFALEGASETSEAAQAVSRRGLFNRRAGIAAAGLAAVGLVAAIVLILSAQDGTRSPGGRHIRSVAVLPFENFSRDPDQKYFSDGMTEALIADLMGISSIRVISRTSVMRFKGTRKPLPEIARELNVEAVVEGSALRSGDRVRITAQLIEGRTDRNLWAQSYERNLRDVLSLQREVARAIAGEIAAVVTPGEALRLNAAARVHPDAYDAYLKGRFHLNRFTRESMKQALDHFNQALVVDPRFARAHAGLADTYSYLRSVYVPPHQVMPQAEAAARKALALDESLAEAHVALGSVLLYYRFDWPSAEREFKRAIDLNPNLSDAHRMYANLLATMGGNEQAIAAIARAKALDPLSLVTLTDASWIHYVARRYDRSLEEAQRAIELDPTFWLAHANAGLAFARLGRFREGIAAVERARDLDRNPLVLETLGAIYAWAGKREEAKRMLAELTRLTERQYVCPYEVAVVYAGLGDNTSALAWLEKSYDQRADCQPWLKVDTQFDALRSMPQFVDLVRRMAYPQ